MECPKCGAEISKSAMVCPNCKKVLKIVCPVCRTINDKNVCKNCGEILVTKCHKCGKVNLLKNRKCVKCGYDNEISAVQNESNFESFAVVRIDFPNSDIIKANFDSNKLYEKFKKNFDKLINGYCESIGVRRQIVDNEIYIIRFNKEYTLTASANAAIQATIDLLNVVTKINVKLLKKKNVALKCNFSIMKRNADKNPYDIDTKFQANMVYQNSPKEMRALDSFQVITDESFYDVYQGHYKMESLNSVLVEGVMKRFYEMDLKEFVHINDILREEAIKEHEDEIEIPNFVQTGLDAQAEITKETLKEANELTDDQIYDIEMIKFEEINCEFVRTESINVLDCVTKTLQEVPKGVLAIRAKDIYQPYTLKLLSAVDELGLYDNVIPITCHDDMKYSPYSFFRDMISSIFEYTVSQKLFNKNDFSMFNKIDNSGLVKDLVTLTERPMQNMEETRAEYCDVFLSLLQAIPNTLIYIENFEKIDSSSLFVLEQMFDHLEDLNVSYLISYDREYSLHKKMHFLLSRPYYTEVALTSTPFETIVAQNVDLYKNILNDFYFQRIAKYAYGSTLFLDFALQYLAESEVYEFTENTIMLVNPKTIVIPSGLDKLVKRRLDLLKDDEKTLKFLTTLVLLGTRVDENTINSLDIEGWEDIAEKLAGMGYIYSYNNCIYFSNYNILRKCLLEVLTTDQIRIIADDLFEKVFVENMPNPVKAYLYDVQQNGEKVILEWESLANINLSMGDFASYLNCSSEILKALDKYAKDWPEEDLGKYKNTLYENVANNMFEYNPDETRELAEETLKNLQNIGQGDKYINLCTKMIEGAMFHGDYLYAMNLTHSVMSSMDKSSIDPTAPDFNLNFLLMSVIYVKILFSMGALKDCLDIGYNVLNVLDNEKLNAINYNNSIITKEEFIMLVTECAGYVALVSVLTMKEDAQEFLDVSRKLLPFLPQSYDIFIQLQNLLKGQTVSIKQSMAGNDMFSGILFHIINAFVHFKNKPNEFAQEIYKAKLISRASLMFPFELFADLMIGYAYIQLNSFRKANAIIYKIIKYAKLKGMNFVTHIAWYVLSILNIKEGKFDLAYGVLNNSDILMEKNGVLSDYMTLLNKVNMYTVLMCSKSKDQAQICMDQATKIVQKHGINFNLNIDIRKILEENAAREVVDENITADNNPEIIESEPEPENSFKQEDADVVDPNEFFSEG